MADILEIVAAKRRALAAGQTAGSMLRAEAVNDDQCVR